MKGILLVLLSIISLVGIVFCTYLGVKLRKVVKYKRYYVLLWLMVAIYAVLFVVSILAI